MPSGAGSRPMAAAAMPASALGARREVSPKRSTASRAPHTCTKMPLESTARSAATCCASAASGLAESTGASSRTMPRRCCADTASADVHDLNTCPQKCTVRPSRCERAAFATPSPPTRESTIVCAALRILGRASVVCVSITPIARVICGLPHAASSWAAMAVLSAWSAWRATAALSGCRSMASRSASAMTGNLPLIMLSGRWVSMWPSR
mmetsp:Transcript_2988/g.7441  ORF Transcript_2988/g.7441 Transcript_2988/m.7441 type:complete len:209 (-) Transcript_2988:220-846(-)